MTTTVALQLDVFAVALLHWPLTRNVSNGYSFTSIDSECHTSVGTGGDANRIATSACCMQLAVSSFSASKDNRKGRACVGRLVSAISDQPSPCLVLHPCLRLLLYHQWYSCSANGTVSTALQVRQSIDLQPADIGPSSTLDQFPRLHPDWMSSTSADNSRGAAAPSVDQCAQAAVNFVSILISTDWIVGDIGVMTTSAALSTTSPSLDGPRSTDMSHSVHP